MTDDSLKPLNDRQKAFKRYKAETAAHGKPFFPFGVWHDLVAATVTMGIILLLTVVWFAQANCDSWFNVNCGNAATPIEQEQYTPDEPGKLIVDDEGKPVEGGDKPLLGALYEDKANPSTTSYHPRPEWYFYFLFYLLIVFSSPQLVIMGTIGLPTIWLVLLIAWPFLDRRKERRPSRRPIAMAAMVVTAVMLLSFTYLGSKAGENAAPEGLTEAQAEMPGYKLIYEDTRGETCFGCHVIVTGSGSVGPDLTEVALKEYGLEYQIQHLADPSSTVPGSQMPAQAGTFSDLELAQLAAFLETLGMPERAEEAEYAEIDEAAAAAALSGADEEASKGSDKAAPAADGDDAPTTDGDKKVTESGAH